MKSKATKFRNRLRVLAHARSGCLWVQTREEFRAEVAINNIMTTLNPAHEVYLWRASVGLFPYGKSNNADKAQANPLKLAENLYNYKGNRPRTVILEDVTPYLNNPQFLRYIKDIGIKSQSAKPSDLVQIVVVDANDPPENGFIKLELDLPNRVEIQKIVEGMVEAVPKEVRKDLKENGNLDTIVDALTGLEAAQAQQAIAESLSKSKRVDPEILLRSKKALISGSSAIEWIDPDPRGLDAVGGLRYLKEYLRKRRKAFRKRTRDTERKSTDWTAKLPRPKAILAAGIPGTGKSLTAKSAAAAWGVPLIRFDVSSAFGKFVGESEKGLKRALKVAESVAPCILWIDEIEKGLAGSGSAGDSDGGTTVRVFGELLTWMQETTAAVYIVATSNDPTKLPPELFRAGRFDQIWWVDTPNKTDRKEVAQVMEQKYGLEELAIDWDQVAESTEQFTPAEMEQAIIEALWQADDDDRAPTTEDILEATKSINPVIHGWGDRGLLKTVRDWAKSAATPANEPESDTDYDANWNPRALDLDD